MASGKHLFDAVFIETRLVFVSPSAQFFCYQSGQILTAILFST
jgi:hypothetical protein